MRCITSVVYTIVINGRHGEEFRPQRGLRQEEPLSQILMINCISQKGGKAFWDKEASIEGANNIKSVIKEYEKVSGQLVNFDKSLIYFSGNVDLETYEHVGGILGVRISNNPERYLGLPTVVKRRKKHAFVDIK
ncbi:reverse transcriptase [Gossypium australe]|uniref:Reverse transcriptase n=1 Tax=Gossypium australe TaxID=47621 RepID=A0A5B6WF81_9ROSI|nr:reverse transcriptase [Gossypium australe]